MTSDTLRFLQGRPVSPWRLRWFLISLATCGIALFASTWKLWTPQRIFPQVPLFAWAGSAPAVVEWTAAGGVFVTLILLLVAGWKATSEGAGSAASPSRVGFIASGLLLAFAVLTLLLFLIDQHRLQPWAYQFVVFALVLAALPAARAFVLLRLLVISIYLWSALAKLDYSFLESQGQQFLAAIVGLAGIAPDAWSPAARQAAALSFPIAEMLIAAGLCFPLHRWKWLRRSVLGLAIAMHALLIAALSPLGLNHQPAVIVWNLWFIAQALLLFGFPQASESAAAPEADARGISAPGISAPGISASGLSLRGELSEVLVEFLVAAVILLPVLNWFGRFDHWLAWGLYAPRNSRAVLYIHQSQAERIPEEIGAHLGEPSEEGWRQLRLNRWSLDAVAVPVYPEDRFQVGVAEAVIREHGLHDAFQLIVQSPADRWTGRRANETIRSIAALEAHRRQYTLNARPRDEGA